MQPIKATQR